MTLSEARPIGQIDQDRSENYRLPLTVNTQVRVRNKAQLTEMDVLRFIAAELTDVPEGGWRAVEQRYKREEQKWQRHAEKMEAERQERLREEDRQREEALARQKRWREEAFARDAPFRIPPVSGWMSPVIVRGLPETGTWNFEQEKSW